MSTPQIDERRALRHLMDFLAIEGLSGQEGNIAKAVTDRLIAAGCKKSWIRHDKVYRDIPGDWEIGNLILKLPGTRRGDRRLFMGHLDTVPLCRGAMPVIKGRRIVSKTPTALGGDNRTSIGALMTMVETLLSQGLDHPPITVLMTVGEEVGLWGARLVDLGDLGNPTMGFNVDSGHPRYIVTGAIGADRWDRSTSLGGRRTRVSHPEGRHLRRCSSPAAPSHDAAKPRLLRTRSSQGQASRRRTANVGVAARRRSHQPGCRPRFRQGRIDAATTRQIPSTRSPASTARKPSRTRRLRRDRRPESRRVGQN